MSGFGEANFSLWLSQFTRTGLFWVFLAKISIFLIFSRSFPSSKTGIFASKFNFSSKIYHQNDMKIGQFREKTFPGSKNVKNLRLPPFE